MGEDLPMLLAEALQDQPGHTDLDLPRELVPPPGCVEPQDGHRGADALVLRCPGAGGVGLRVRPVGHVQRLHVGTGDGVVSEGELDQLAPHQAGKPGFTFALAVRPAQGAQARFRRIDL